MVRTLATDDVRVIIRIELCIAELNQKHYLVRDFFQLHELSTCVVGAGRGLREIGARECEARGELL